MAHWGTFGEGRSVLYENSSAFIKKSRAKGGSLRRITIRAGPTVLKIREDTGIFWWRKRYRVMVISGQSLGALFICHKISSVQGEPFKAWRGSRCIFQTTSSITGITSQ